MTIGRAGGMLTFMLTDVEGSTGLWEAQPAAMAVALARHDALFERVVERHGGLAVRARGEGDSHFAVFADAPAAVAAAEALQRSLPAALATTGVALRVRVALHTGTAEARAGDYYGPTVNRCARLRGIARGGQILLSGSTAELARDALPTDAELRDLGVHRLKDVPEPISVFELLHLNRPTDLPPTPTWPATARSAAIRGRPRRTICRRERPSDDPTLASSR